MKTITERVTIRPLNRDDIGTAIELLKKTGLFVEFCDTEEAYIRMLEHNPKSILVMTYNESVIGMVMIVYSPIVSIIFHLCIDPEHRRQRLGTYLLVEAEKTIQELGGTEDIGGYIEKTNVASLSLFRKFGYKAYPTPLVCMYKNV